MINDSLSCALITDLVMHTLGCTNAHVVDRLETVPATSPETTWYTHGEHWNSLISVSPSVDTPINNENDSPSTWNVMVLSNRCCSFRATRSDKIVANCVRAFTALMYDDPVNEKRIRVESNQSKVFIQASHPTFYPEVSDPSFSC